jgi:hypothetical protein
LSHHAKSHSKQTKRRNLSKNPKAQNLIIDSVESTPFLSRTASSPTLSESSLDELLNALVSSIPTTPSFPVDNYFATAIPPTLPTDSSMWYSNQNLFEGIAFNNSLETQSPVFPLPPVDLGLLRMGTDFQLEASAKDAFTAGSYHNLSPCHSEVDMTLSDIYNTPFESLSDICLSEFKF